MESSNNNGDFQHQQPAEGSQNQPSQPNYNYQTQGFQPNYQSGYQGGYNNYQQGGYQGGYQSNYNNNYNSNYQGEYQGGYQGGYNNNYHNNYNNNSYNNNYNNYQGDFNQGGYRRGGNNRYNKYSNTFQPSVFSLPDLPISGKSTPNTATTNSSTTSLSSLASALKEVEETPITEFINKAKEAKTISEIRTAAGELAELLFKEGADKIEKYNLVSQITTLSKSKKSALAREGALLILSTVSRKFGINSPAEAYLLSAFTLPLDLLSDKDKSVARAANTCTDTLLTSYPMDAQTGVLLSVLFKYIEGSAKWQGKVGAIKLVERIVEEVPAESLELTFIEAIPALTFAMNDMKAEVSKAGTKALANFAQKLDNQDVVPRVDIIVKTLADPTKVPDCIKTFSHVTFVAEVTESALAVLVPILWRALNQAASSQDLLRQTVIVVENLTRLVHNPVEVKAFIPELLPGIKRVVETASQPEVRELASKAAKVLEDAEKEDPANKSRVLSTEVADKFPENVDTTLSEYASKVLAADINNRDWNLLFENFKVYFGEKATNEYNEETVKYFRSLFRDSKINDDKEEGIQIVNAEFSLAYGGRMLLNKTFLRLYKGRRYGLCGRNGAGKSTLMRSIASGKLEGFPDKSELKTCFVEHKIQGSEADLDLVSFIASDPELASVGKEEVAKALAEVGFDEDRRSQNVGALSGGWKMKLELARAMLMKADILLLDEPTNHLDVTNVKWLEDYLVAHTEITSLIVSHDSGFLDAVCTDIIHYETKKLVYYKGNLSEFVKVRPEGKAYYTLTDSNVKMAFPPPGILTGVRSNTRAIARMTDVTFTYPGAAKPSLKHVTCSLSLSSRVAILGPNGAGKSTLIKLLTGELIPSEGIVEKHPNLRIGYIAQHALQHVEQHKEKTPNQYLQWRYANGDDREVHLKQTRKMSDEEREQMEKPIAYDGKSPRQVEAIIGRSKLKKSFQYEIKWKGWLPKFNSFIPREELIELGFAKAVQQFDDHEASREGLGYRDLSPPVIRQHFEDVGLDGDIADHTPLGSLSGGQLVKVVIAGAMWNNPHLLVLDEPTNYLDRDSLGGLAVAIREWTGGVVMISHNEEFVGALCPEQWIVDNGEVVQKGKTEVASDRFEDGSLAAAVAKAKDNDSPANIKIRKKKKKLTRNEMKERESRRRLRYIEWLNSPKGTPRPPDTDDEAD